MIHTYVWEPCMHKRVRDPTCRRGWETKRENGDETHPELRMRWGVGGFEGSLQTTLGAGVVFGTPPPRLHETACNTEHPTEIYEWPFPSFSLATEFNSPFVSNLVSMQSFIIITLICPSLFENFDIFSYSCRSFGFAVL